VGLHDWLGDLDLASPSVSRGTAVGSQAISILGCGGNYGLGRRFGEKKPRGRNTSLSRSYERVNEFAKWFGGQEVQSSLSLRKG